MISLTLPAPHTYEQNPASPPLPPKKRQHFSSQPANSRIDSLFSHHEKSGYLTSQPGIWQKTLVNGKNRLMTGFLLDTNSTLPRHKHPHEQTGDLVSGHMTLRVDDEDLEIRPGEGWKIPCNVGNSAIIHGNPVAIEIFVPVRGEYLPVQGILHPPIR